MNTYLHPGLAAALASQLGQAACQMLGLSPATPMICNTERN